MELETQVRQKSKILANSSVESQVKQTLKKIKLSTPKGVPPHFVPGTRTSNEVPSVRRDINTKGKKEKILVALSGGKDSAVTAFLLKKFGYNIEGLYIDLGISEYSKKCLGAVKKLCEELGIKLHVYDMKKEQGKTMQDVWKKIKKKRLNNCAVCGVFKKWILNKTARKLKADKIATGHNLDDQAQTCLMNVLKGSPKMSFSSGPVTKNISDKKFVPRIKPLFYVFEEDVKKYAIQKKIPFIEGKCKYSQESYRGEVRDFVNTLSEKDKKNILNNFEKIFVKDKKSEENKIKIKYCKICGEPSRKNVCKKCELMK
ncbi:TIGR00269 family protein [Candidatus Pacearchaeota archaeon]|nr:TIGR00269 family protein [Candidatus Pacearchaeota archaeon]